MGPGKFGQEAARLFAQQNNEMLVPEAYDAAAGVPHRNLTPEETAHAQCMTVFDSPLVGVASADDEIFERFKEPWAIGDSYVAPSVWLEGARSVVSLFFPFSEEVRRSNYGEGKASLAWQYAKPFGQEIIYSVCLQLCEELKAQGYRAIVPCKSEGFSWDMVDAELNGEPNIMPDCSWSERHAAFACGLGTFGISKGLITRKGMAGRFGSLITDAPIVPTPREYTEVYEWCSHCNTCVRRCPVDAITPQGDKNNLLCEQWISEANGCCAKCQVSVPCEHQRP